MSGGLNGNAPRRPRVAYDMSQEIREELDTYKDECSADRAEIRQAVTNIRSDFTVMTAKLDTVLGLFVRERPTPEGQPTEYAFHFPKISLKRLLKWGGAIVLGFGSSLAFLQFIIFLFGQAVHWIVAYGH